MTPVPSWLHPSRPYLVGISGGRDSIALHHSMPCLLFFIQFNRLLLSLNLLPQSHQNKQNKKGRCAGRVAVKSLD